jgi:Zn-dependent membrane protease YugP
LILGLSLSSYAYLKVKNVYNKYIGIPNFKNVTGANVAKTLLNKYGLLDVKVEIIGGNLTDKYDAKHNAIKLTNYVYSNSSITALGISAHVVGHAIQYKEEYPYFKLGNIIAFYSSIISNFSHLIILIGFVFRILILIKFGIIIFCAIVLINLFTIFVELNASKRAKFLINEVYSPDMEESYAINEVLFAASLNYSATMIKVLSSILVVIKRSLRSIMKVLK